MPSASTKAYSFVVDDYQATWKFAILSLAQKAIKGPFGLLNRGRPDPQANYPSMAPNWMHSGIGEVFVECEHDRRARLSPIENDLVGNNRETEFARTQNRPARSLFLRNSHTARGTF